MALSATTIAEVETGGSDTANSGLFDPGQTAGMLTDGAATSATTASPVFTSASYNFVAGDVGAWVFIGAGTNWIQGWYKIASVASNAATLTATAGSAVIRPNNATSFKPSTATGCASVTSPTGATWSIDYSQQASPKNTYTDLASTGAGLTVSSAAKPFGKQQVGNGIVITGGTNFTTGRYVIASVSVANVATVVGPGNITTGAGASGTGSLGGALASAGQAGAHVVASNLVYVKTGSYTVTSASTNIAAGCFAPAGASITVEGYDTVRGDLFSVTATGTRPTITASGISTFTLFSLSGGTSNVRNLILDGGSLTSSRGVNSNGISVYNVHGKNMTNSVIGATSAWGFRCSGTGCSTAAVFANTGGCVSSVAYSNTITGFSGGVAYLDCIATTNTGASSDGFASGSGGVQFRNCTSYGNGRDGFRDSASQTSGIQNCIAEGNGGFGYTLSGATGAFILTSASYNNTSGATSITTGRSNIDVTALTGSPFTNAAGGDFSLNTTTGAGASCRAAGYPGVFPGISTTGYLDMGAAQHIDPAILALYAVE